MNKGTPIRATAPTLEAVAAVAGVSRATVSRVVNGSTEVTAAVTARVQDAIKQLDYVPNRAARSLANNKTMAIAFVVPENAATFFSDPFFAALISGVVHALEHSDYVLNLQLAKAQSPSSKTAKYLLGGNVDGALVASHHSGDEFLTQLSAVMPVVFGGRPPVMSKAVSAFVDVDNVDGASKGTSYLIAKGRRRIGCISGPEDMAATADRTRGWRDALSANGLADDLITPGDFTQESGELAMAELLLMDSKLDAVFVQNDLMALGAIRTLQRNGIRVPEDVSIMGFDDSPAATSGPIALTTVRQPSFELGEQMAETLLRILSGEEARPMVLMETSVVVRESA